jgi:hypothetical protein
LGAQVRQIFSVVNFAAIQLTILAMLNFEIRAVSHIDSYIVFFVAAVWLARRRGREESVANLPEESPVPGICVANFERDLATRTAVLTELRPNVTFVNIKVHDLSFSLFRITKQVLTDRMVGHGESVAKRSGHVKNTFSALPESILCVLYLPDRPPNGISEQASECANLSGW